MHIRMYIYVEIDLSLSLSEPDAHQQGTKCAQRTGGKSETLLPHPRQFEFQLVKLWQSEVSP